MRVSQCADARLNFAFANMRQLDREKNNRQNHKDDAKEEVWHLDRFRPVDAGFGKVLKNQIAADERPGRRAK